MDERFPIQAGPTPPGAPEDGASLGARALRGTLWTTGGYLLRQVIRLGSNLVLARLLFPEAFGLMALVNVFLTGLGMFSDLGIGLNVVQSRRGDDPVFLDTAYTVQVLRGVVLFAAALAAAWPVAAFYDAPELRWMIPVAGVAVLLQGFYSTGIYRLQRHLSLARFELVETAGQVVPAVVMVAWALVSPTVWALVAGAVVGNVVRVILSHWIVADHRPRLRWEPAAARELVDFGKWVFLSTILTFLADQTDRLLVGKLVPLALLGAYSIAAMFAHLPVQLMTKLGALIAFPVFSRTRDRQDDLEPVFRRARRPLFAVGGAVVIVLAISARPLIETLYDPRYAPAGWMLALLAVRSWFQILQVPRQSALLAMGQPRSIATTNGVKLAAMGILVPVGYSAAGLEGVILALVAADAMRFAAMAWVSSALGVRSLGADVAVSGILGAMVVIGTLLVAALDSEGVAASRCLLAALLAATVLWAPVAYGLLRGERRLLLSLRTRRPV